MKVNIPVLWILCDTVFEEMKADLAYSWDALISSKRGGQETVSLFFFESVCDKMRALQMAENSSA